MARPSPSMTSRERLLTAIHHEEPDHVPLYSWTFGLAAPPHLRWTSGGRPVPYWYTGRLEHIHTLPEPWDFLEDDCRRVRAWLGLGVDDVLDVSVPWSLDPKVTVRQWEEPPSGAETYPVVGREYVTPAGVLRHVIRQTQEEVAPGWVVQPAGSLPLIEDYNIPRGVKPAVADRRDVECLPYLLRDPDAGQAAAYRQRLEAVAAFARREGVLVQAWTGFGMDAVVWLCGVEGAVMLAVLEPETFQALIDVVHDWDVRRTRFALEVGGVDMVVQRGWYSATTFWSPTQFRRYIAPQIKHLAEVAHDAGKLFGYVVTAGLDPVLEDFAGLGVDLLYYADPVQGGIDLRRMKTVLGGKTAMSGGVNSGVTLARSNAQEIREEVREAVRVLAPGGGFVLSPVDALFPDTPWSSVEAMIAAWREVADYPIRV